jgi:nitrous oxide reductase
MPSSFDFSANTNTVQAASAQNFDSKLLSGQSSLSALQQNSSMPITHVASTNRTFYIYNTKALGFNEMRGINQSGLVSDQFSLLTMVVNKGDRVTVKFYNMEAKSGNRHSFTIDPPYQVNIDIKPRQNGTANFVANHVGVFRYYCLYHAPSMSGELVVLPAS